MPLNRILEILPYFIVKRLALRCCEKLPYKGYVVEVFVGEGITLKDKGDNQWKQ